MTAFSGVRTLALTLAIGVAAVLRALPARADPPPADEGALGEFVVTGTVQERVPKIAILPSWSPAYEDVIVRNVVRGDLELSGMFDVIPDKDAPKGEYAFDDPVDIAAWRKIGAEAIVKVAARGAVGDKIEVLGLAYFLNVGKDPVYQKKLVVTKDKARITGHRVTDALLGALTGRPGGFASHFTFTTRWGSNYRVFTMDSDGQALAPASSDAVNAISPTWGPNGALLWGESKNYAPFRLIELDAGAAPRRIGLPTQGSVYGIAFDKSYTKLALAVAEAGGRTAIYTGNPDGSNLQKVSNTEQATHPVFSPSGKLAWLGGGDRHGTQRVFVDGKAVSPPGFIAAAPAFCDTEDGVFLVYAVTVGGDRQDLVLSNDRGGGIQRLTQNQGSNSYPACSPDGRLLAFFSTRDKAPGLYLMSLKRWKTQKLAGQVGTSLRWASLPPPLPSETP